MDDQPRPPSQARFMAQVPAQIMGHPCPQTETRLSRRAVAPGGRRLGHAPAAPVGLERQFQRQREARLPFDRDLFDDATAVGAEIIGSVVDRQTRTNVQRHAGQARQGALQPRAAFLPAAAHVARPRRHIGPVAHQPAQRRYVTRLVGTVGHHHHDHVAAAGLEPRLQRIENAASQCVVDEPHGWAWRLHGRDRWQGRILGEIVDDQDLMGFAHFALHVAQERLDVVGFVEDGDDERGEQFRQGDSSSGQMFP